MGVIDGNGRGWVVDSTGNVVELTPKRALQGAVRTLNALQADAVSKGDYATALELGIVSGQAAVMQVLDNLPGRFNPSHSATSPEKIDLQHRIREAQIAYDKTLRESEALRKKGVSSAEKLRRDVLDARALRAWRVLCAEYESRFEY